MATHIEKVKACPQRRQLALQFIRGLKELYAPRVEVKGGWQKNHSENVPAPVQAESGY